MHMRRRHRRRHRSSCTKVGSVLQVGEDVDGFGEVALGCSSVVRNMSRSGA